MQQMLHDTMCLLEETTIAATGDAYQVRDRYIKLLLQDPQARRINRLLADLPSTLEIDSFLLLRKDSRNILGSAGRNLVI